jgi:DNA-binding CsgD family transcriptional regulator
VASEVNELASITEDSDAAIEANMYRISDLMELGDFRAVHAELGGFTESIERIRNPFLSYVHACLVTNLDIFAGRFGEAEKRAGDSYAMGEKLDGHDPLGMFGVQMFTLSRERGRLRELEPAVSGFVNQGDNALWRPGLALIYADLGLADRAREQFELVAEAGFESVPRDAMWAGTLAYLSEVCWFVEDEERAAQLYELLLPSAMHNVTIGVPPVSLGPASRYLGLLADTMGDWDVSERHFEIAIEMCTTMGSEPLMARTQLDFADALARRGDDAGLSHAAVLLEGATTTADELGMQAIFEHALALKDRLVNRGNREKHPDGLSPREVEVLSLIAAGHGNRDIAERLYIAPNTVANHVKSIFSKTGSANRAEAAAYAVRNQLEREGTKDGYLPAN